MKKKIIGSFQGQSKVTVELNDNKENRDYIESLSEEEIKEKHLDNVTWREVLISVKEDPPSGTKVL